MNKNDKLVVGDIAVINDDVYDNHYEETLIYRKGQKVKILEFDGNFFDGNFVLVKKNNSRSLDFWIESKYVQKIEVRK